MDVKIQMNNENFQNTQIFGLDVITTKKANDSTHIVRPSKYG